MSVSYRLVQWNRHKKIYDAVLALSVVLFLVGFVGVSIGLGKVTEIQAVIRATGVAAIIMLHFILIIGPLARLSTRFNVLLYNRRHFGVMMFFVALIHGGLSTVWYHGFGNENPIISIFTANTNYTSFTQFPFQPLGFVALLILFVMAATSHDFWLKNLTPRIWKSLHMFVYLAYVLLIGHVALGALQQEASPLYIIALGFGLLLVVGLHLLAGFTQAKRDAKVVAVEGEWIDIGAVDDLVPDVGCTINLGDGQAVAVFRHGEQGQCVSAMSNVCKHQGGPLGEGQIVDGCVTCPWHGYQYRPEDGQSPPPYTEKLATYEVKVEGQRVLINPEAKPEGTPVVPAQINGGSS